MPRGAPCTTLRNAAPSRRRCAQAFLGLRAACVADLRVACGRVSVRGDGLDGGALPRADPAHLSPRPSGPPGRSIPTRAPRAVQAKKNFFGGPASPTKPKVTQKAKPLSPGSNYPSTRNIQRQSTGFGNFVQKFQKARRDD